MYNNQVNSYKELIVWQKAMELVVEIYRLTEKFPREEIYGLISQMRRCAVSIPSNIAEGRRRGSRNDFSRFLSISYGSGAELETQIEISIRLGYCQKEELVKSENLLTEIMKMLNTIIKNLRN
jgi:four helix bundle protein